MATPPPFTPGALSQAGRAVGRANDSWVLEQLSAATAASSRGTSLAIVAGLVVAVGVLDFLTGVRVSLVLFYLIPIVLSVTWLGWRAGCITAFASTVVRIVGDLAGGGYHYPVIAYWNRFIDLLMYFVVVMILHALISLLREVDERVRQRTAALEKATAERAQLQTELFEISQSERSAIGHDLHDGLGQHLTATSIAANLLANTLAADGHASAKDARNIARMLQSSIATTRKIARGLLLAAVEPSELVPELEELAATIGLQHTLVCRFVHEGVEADSLSVAVASHLFYIAREAAHNAARHADATAVEISLLAVDGALELAVIDNGKGLLEPDGPSEGMGQRIMAHRTELIGGLFRTEPGPDGGTAVRCRVPVLAARAAVGAR